MLEILIGREEGVVKPRLTLTREGKVSYLGNPGSVPKSVSRKHCRLVLHDDATLSITDITDENFMYVNGIDCKSRGKITIKDTVELGPDRYKLDLPTIVKAFSSQQTYHIAYLENVQAEYNKAKMDNQISQGRLNALSALPGVLSMSSMVLAACTEYAEVRIPMIVLAALFALGFAVIRIRNASRNPVKLKKLDDDYREKYVCPNPMCQHHFGQTQYKELLRSQGCPYCKARFVE